MVLKSAMGNDCFRAAADLYLDGLFRRNQSKLAKNYVNKNEQSDVPLVVDAATVTKY